MVVFLPIPTEEVRRLQAGGADAFGCAPERAVSDGQGNPCRHCLRQIPQGAEILILAHRPFAAPQPYAETGPIFLCAAPCEPWLRPGVPPILQSSDSYLLRGYGADDRIVYGTGAVTPRDRVTDRALALLERPEVAYLHVRSAANNCFQCRIERG